MENVILKTYLHPSTALHILKDVEKLISINHPVIEEFLGFYLDIELRLTAPKLQFRYYDGEFLSNALQCRKLSPTDRSIILYGLSSVLDYLNSHHIYLGDLRSNRIIILRNHHPIITDIISNNKENYHPYIPIECMDDNKLSQFYDIWSFSMVLYEIFTELPPFHNMSHEAIKETLLNGQRPSFPSDLESHPISHLISQCWDESPWNRPSFNSILTFFSNNAENLIPGTDLETFHQSKTLFQRKEPLFKSQSVQTEYI